MITTLLSSLYSAACLCLSQALTSIGRRSSMEQSSSLISDSASTVGVSRGAAPMKQHCVKLKTIACMVSAGLSVIGTSVVCNGMVGACQRTSGGSTYKRLTRANGWGSAGQCPASACAKTPAAQERDCHVVVKTSSRSPVQAAAGGGVEA